MRTECVSRGFLAASVWLTTTLALPAQTAPAKPSTEETVTLETFVVVGEWGALQAATEGRRQAKRLVDIVNPDDIGVLPDFNVGESLQRLPGISIDLDQAEARFVTIRGFNAGYNTTTINGGAIAVPDRNGRRVFMDVLPASLASSFEVTKTQTADMEGHSVSGAIDIKGPVALRKQPLTVKIDTKIGTYTEGDGYRGSGPSGTADLLVTRQITPNMGLAISANFYRRDSYTPQAEWGSSRLFYTDAGVRVTTPYGGNGYAVPVERRWYSYHNLRTRTGGSAKWEYRPAKSREFWALAYFNTAVDDEVRQTDLLAIPTSVAVTNQTATSGTISGSGLSQQIFLGKFDFERTIWGLQAGGDLDLGAAHKLSISANYSGAHFDNPENWNEWRQGGTQLAVNYQLAGDVIQFTDVNPAARANYAAYAPNRRQFDVRSLWEQIYEAQVNLLKREASGDGLGYKVGAKFRRADRSFNENRDRYLPNTGNTYTLGASGAVNSQSPTTNPPGALPGQAIIVIDPSISRESFDAHYGANASQWRFDPMVLEDNNLDYSITEDIAAAYALLTYEKNDWSANAGVRLEDTGYEAAGRSLVNNVWQDRAVSGGYSNWLPSFVVSRPLGKQNRILLGASKTIGRAPFNSFAPVGERITDTAGSLRITRPNPDLKPREATNFNLSLEHYFARNRGMIGVAVYLNELKNEFFTATSQMDLVYEGQEREATITQPMNNSRLTKVRAFEIVLLRDLDFLPDALRGFKFNGNVTFIDSDFAIQMTDGSFFATRTMIGQPDLTYNAALLYDRGRFTAKVAVNHTGLKLTERVNTAESYRNRYDTASTRVSLNAAYRLNKNWRAHASVWNLTEEGRGEVLGNAQEIPIVQAEFGAAYFVGFTYSFK
jgi:TonB-dependent receptor